MLNAQWGIVNYLLSLVGIPPQAWLGDTTLVQIAVIGVYVWLDVSFVFLVFLGGLTALPVEPFEAASMDGASALQSFRYITLPLMTPVILVIVITRIIDAFRAFDVIYALTEGGPGDSSRVIALELYQIAFSPFAVFGCRGAGNLDECVDDCFDCPAAAAAIRYRGSQRRNPPEECATPLRCRSAQTAVWRVLPRL